MNEWLYRSRLLLLQILGEASKLSNQLSELDTRCCGSTLAPLNGRTEALDKLQASFSSLRMACVSCASMIGQWDELVGSPGGRGRKPC